VLRLWMAMHSGAQVLPSIAVEVVMRTLSAVLVAGLLALSFAATPAFGHQDYPLKTFTLSVRECAFNPVRIEVDYLDRVRITLVAEDRPHSLVIEAYRICKIATVGRPVTFEFLADRSGTFKYFSDLSSDSHCVGMQGQLVVR
jgi:heme/copper-type cytochrome/quinol oxidase subunit 2